MPGNSIPEAICDDMRWVTSAHCLLFFAQRSANANGVSLGIFRLRYVSDVRGKNAQRAGKKEEKSFVLTFKQVRAFLNAKPCN